MLKQFYLKIKGVFSFLFFLYLRIDTDKENLSFPPPKSQISTQKAKSKKSAIKTFESRDQEKKIQFKNEPKVLNSKTQLYKEKSEKVKSNKKRYPGSKEGSRFKRIDTKQKKSNKLTSKEEIKELETMEKRQGKKFDDFELNELPYEEAILYDKRTWPKTYFALLKREHRFIFTFFVCNDYNIFVVKMSRFIFLLATDIAMNVFFFSDATMHKVFLDYGKYNFVQQIPQILYSSIISQITEVFLCFLSLTDTHIYEIKGLNITHLNERNKNLIQEIFEKMKKKLSFYFIFTFVFFLGYWYVVACFCAVYPNTQTIFLKDCLMSILFSFLYPFILYTFPSAFRKCALGCKNNNCLFKFSEVIPFF